MIAEKKLRILIVLTYYRPHTSGLTIYAERLAKAFALRGHQVTVLTSQFNKELPREEMVEGVRIVRAPVLLRISKGVIMPTFGWLASKMVLEHDVVQLHLPQFDAAGISLRGRMLKRPTVITYHCDLNLPKGIFNFVVNRVVDLMNHMAALFTHRIVTYTQDYAEHSPYIRNYLEKLQVISPPVELPEATKEEIEAFAASNNPQGNHPVIGMAARFASEKGVEILLDAMPTVLEKFPNTLVQFAGAFENIMGEEHYFKRLEPTITKYQKSGNWQFLGNLDPKEMRKFYSNIDVNVLPSLNATEAFGLVQIEAMINGSPSIASNLPGVRQPVKRHDMGEIFPIGDADGLAQSLIKVLSNHDQYIKPKEPIIEEYLPDSIAEKYEALFEEIFQELQ
ncbi:MAG: glycosyltransferase family 4 protein [Anaerolineaceae bacterium]|nr:glycosyltransferase family 4 protein [Anaerolineaceae bacterium]